jgi:hypothetical protein
MLRFIGALVVIAAVIIGIGVCTHYVDVGVRAKITQQGQQNIQKARNNLADEIRGK